jgi:hypothetical protein
MDFLFEFFDIYMNEKEKIAMISIFLNGKSYIFL